MSEWEAPDNLRALVLSATNNGKSFIVNHHTDTSGTPFVEFRSKWGNSEVRLTWHTRETGTYRLFSAVAAGPGRPWHTVSATKALSLIASPYTLECG